MTPRRKATKRGMVCLCCLTFELSCDRRWPTLARGRQDATGAWSGQVTAAVGRQLERGVRPRCFGAKARRPAARFAGASPKLPRPCQGTLGSWFRCLRRCQYPLRSSSMCRSAAAVQAGSCASLKRLRVHSERLPRTPKDVSAAEAVFHHGPRVYSGLLIPRGDRLSGDGAGSRSLRSLQRPRAGSSARPNVRAKLPAEADGTWPRKAGCHRRLERPSDGCRSGSA
jgi:hypothetical protein